MPTRRVPPPMPDTVKIGHMVWTIDCTEEAINEARKEEGDQDLAGHSWPRKQRISIDPELGPDIKRETLNHELMHAAFAAGGSPDLKGVDDPEELFVCVASPQYLVILADNPDVVKYLAG